MASATLPTAAPAVALRDVRKVHGKGDGAVVALDGVSIALPTGSFTAVMGPSGSGKSTFLNVAAGLDRTFRLPAPFRVISSPVATRAPR